MFDSPTLIVNEAICRNNIQAMVKKCNKLNIKFRPHFKTHQSHKVGLWFRDYGVDRIAVSSVPMAEYFASGNWNDITIAFPFVKQQAKSINSLASRISINLIASSLGNAELLSSYITSKVRVEIEIDTGQSRSGVLASDHAEIERIVEILLSKQNISFHGFLTHAGHSYQATNEEILILHARAQEQLMLLREKWVRHFPNLNISYGDTPTSLICNNFDGIDELRPGNFVFFDMQQAAKGVCSTNDIAIAMVCPVVAVYPQKNRAIIWGGAVQLSKDFYTDSDGKKSHGAICKLNPDLTRSEPIEGLYIESLSQEHGVIRATNHAALAAIEEGELIAILPAHSCLAVDAMQEYWVIEKGLITTMKR